MTRLLKNIFYGITVTSLLSYGYYEFQLIERQKVIVKAGLKSMMNSFRAVDVVMWSIGRYTLGLRGLQSGTEQYEQKKLQIHELVAKDILELSHQNLGLYLKFGQYLGNLHKILPKEYTEKLRTLQDKAPSVPYDQIKVIIEEDLGADPKTIFQSFQQQAFSAASIAQVHRAKLRNNHNIQVAVKLQYPTLKMQCDWDLQVIDNISKIIQYFLQYTDYKQLDVVKLFKTWTSTIKHQLDFSEEIRNGNQTRLNFKDDPYVRIPKFYQQYCSDRIIVMEYMKGCKIDQKQEIEKMGVAPKEVATKLTEIMAKMIFKYGFVHCDAHPGNILVHRSQNNPHKFQIIVLDHGMYKQLDKDFLKSFSKLWIGMMESSQKKMKEAASQLKIEDHIEYLPLLFMNRTNNSRKKIGQNFTDEQKQYFKERKLRSFDDIAQFIQDLPPELMFVIRTSNLVALHNLALGGTRRNRILTYTKLCAMQFSTIFSQEYQQKSGIKLRSHFNQAMGVLTFILALQALIYSKQLKQDQLNQEFII